MPRAKKGHRKDGRVQIKRVIGHDYDGNPINKWFSGKDKKEAEQKYFEYQLELEKKDQHKKQMPFEEWAETWLYDYKQNEVKSTSFDSSYRQPCDYHIIPYFKDAIIQDISALDVKRFLNSIKDKSQSFIDKVIICLNGIFESAIDNDIVNKNPCRNIKVKSAKEKDKKRTYDAETVKALCSVKHKYAIYFKLILTMGLRSSELCGLRWLDINFTKKTMTIRQAITSSSSYKIIDAPKSANSTRTLPIPDDLLAELQNLERSGEYVCQKDGEAFYPKRIYNYLKIFYNYLKIPQDKRLSPHELRHTCGTLLYQSTKDIFYVSRFLGHSDISITTKIYVHSTLQDEQVHLDFNV